MSKKRKPVSILKSLIVILLFACLGIFAYVGYSYFDNQKPIAKQSQVVEVEIQPGTSLKAITKQLQQAGIVRQSDLTYYYVKFNHLGNVKAGKYDVDLSWDLKTIFTYLNQATNAKQDQAKVTITEGDWAKDIAKKIAKETNVTEEELLTLWNDQAWISSLQQQYPMFTDEMFQDGVRIYLEGYLAPETYYFKKETTAKDVTFKILDQTKKVYDTYAQDIHNSGLSIHQFYTLASIVQYEGGGNQEDLKLIAGVFLNRLNRQMKLESSVTVCYAIDFDKDVDNWKACEFNGNFDSPYNTYLHQGLPPGPIQNPGQLVFDALLHPTASDYLYFVADINTGKVYYAKTYQEHLQNVKEHPVQ